ncbi:5'-methylthioadenosine/S-adenosylhomocysteine nucleosidase [Thiomicrospira cyclica]|jgi:adenosylhomocysteine nucleosidase|uniref:5'-methylthioadenosine/S-adenosylhomocysteine nucleosidase n=1 Tax=Thiomicrospira cyclica (strain DSM 14477 / JCM 11371 / ALM1) TaxID=717773 RepID=F6DB49_THICA|nr:5'-methylthioadenosine/S-adenosylhomocysteine nucleosidase [Thiomicrospira cyclica]AEG30789.1 5'-methylthioadenosine/S-adenosylhomocysteine nucleosidase [Thiomicrospira cyclica ALM1]
MSQPASLHQTAPIAVIAAMEEEIILLREQLVDRETIKIAGFEFYQGRIADRDVVLLRSGIGKVNAAMSTAILIDRFAPQAVINTGSAGGFHTDLEVGDIVISSSVCHHDVDVTPFGYVHGQLPGLPACFIPDEMLIAKAKLAIESLGEVTHMHGLIATGDRFVHLLEDVAHTRTKFPEMIACEMEAAAVAQVCHQFEMPFVIIRALSDIAGKENVIAFDAFLAQAADHSTRVVVAMIKQFEG